MSLEVTGKNQVYQREQVSFSSIQKRISCYNRRYPQHIMIEFTQDKCDLLNIYKVGEDVSFDQFKRS
jgi:hypothetical protein